MGNLDLSRTSAPAKRGMSSWVLCLEQGVRAGGSRRTMGASSALCCCRVVQELCSWRSSAAA